MDSESTSTISNPSGDETVTTRDLDLLCLVLDDLLRLSDVRGVVSLVRQQLRLLLADASDDQASSTVDEGGPDAASEL